MTEAPVPGARPRAQREPGQPLLRVRSLVKAFGGVKAVDELAFDVRRGEILGIIGPNGSGKTTLVNCISGIYLADQGSIVLDGEDVTRLPPHRIARLGIARTFQNIRLVDDLSVLDNVAVARAVPQRVSLLSTLSTARLGAQWQQARSWAWQALQQLGLAARAHEPCGALPYGAKRLVEIARAMATEPCLLLLDEPAAGLNETEQADLAARLARLAALGMTVVVIEHNMPFLTRLAHRMICLENGQLLAEGTPAEVCSHPRVVEAYLGSVLDIQE